MAGKKASDEQKKATEEYWDKYTGGFKAVAAELARHSEMWKKFYSEQITQAQKVEEERVRISEEGAKETAAQMRAVTEKETQINLDNLRQLEERLNSATRSASAGRESTTSIKGMIGADQNEIATATNALRELQAEKQRLETDKGFATDEASIRKYDDAINKVNADMDKMQAITHKATADIQKEFERAMAPVTQSLDTLVSGLIGGTERISQAFRKMTEQLVVSLVQSLIKMETRHIAYELATTALIKPRTRQKQRATRSRRQNPVRLVCWPRSKR